MDYSLFSLGIGLALTSWGVIAANAYVKRAVESV